MGKITDQAAKKTQAKLTAPALLRAGHITYGFDCGEDVLNIWLKKRALPAIAGRTANTFVVCRGRRVVGYYSLATASIGHSNCNAALRRNSPDPVPAMLLARLAVDLKEAGQGLGPDLVMDAQMRVLRAAKHVAARTLLVHVLDHHDKEKLEKRINFYSKLGFRRLDTGLDIITMHLRLEHFVAAIKQAYPAP